MPTVQSRISKVGEQCLKSAILCKTIKWANHVDIKNWWFLNENTRFPWKVCNVKKSAGSGLAALEIKALSV